MSQSIKLYLCLHLTFFPSKLYPHACSDRYVIYGNHRDSWVHGAVDPSSGTAVMLEITRILGQMAKTGEFMQNKKKKIILFKNKKYYNIR